MQNIKSILVWAPNWIGDIILSIPTIRALKNRFPESSLTLVVRSPLGDILKEEKSVDHLIANDPDDKHATLSGKIALVRELREHRFDLAIALPNSFRAGAMLFLSGAKKRVGYASDSRGFLLTHPIPARTRQEEGHRIDYFLRIAEEVGCSATEKSLSLETTAEEREEAERILSGHGVQPGDLLIGVHPGASKPPRTLAPSRFAEICKLACRKWKAKIFLFGTSRERKLVEEVLGNVGEDGVFTIARDLSLRAIISLMERCDYFVGCDSGLMHMAAAVGTPLVGLFGPGIPEHTGPACGHGKKSIVFHRFPCAPCRQSFFQDCEPSRTGRPPCMEKIQVEEVMEGLERLMGGWKMENGKWKMENGGWEMEKT